jgi:hypothetical protein
MKPQTTFNRHLYLYAKGHYDRTLPFWWSLACIVGHWLGEDPHTVSIPIIVRHIVSQALDNWAYKGYNVNDSRILDVLVDGLGIGCLHYRNESNPEYVCGIWFGKDKTVLKQFTRRLLSEFSLTLVADIPELGEPDPTVLPVKARRDE